MFGIIPGSGATTPTPAGGDQQLALPSNSTTEGTHNTLLVDEILPEATQIINSLVTDSLTPLSPDIANRITQSKYAMLEIFRFCYSREEAVMTMRGLSRKFMKMSKDSYLENFSQSHSSMFIEVRKDEDFELLKAANRYCNILNISDCMTVDFFYCFEKHHTDQHLLKVADTLAKSIGYAKLTIGSNRMSKMPQKFLTYVLQGLSLYQTPIKKLVLDFQDYDSKVLNGDLMLCDQGLVEAGQLCKLNKKIDHLCIWHGFINNEQILKQFLQAKYQNDPFHKDGIKGLTFQQCTIGPVQPFIDVFGPDQKDNEEKKETENNTKPRLVSLELMNCKMLDFQPYEFLAAQQKLSSFMLYATIFKNDHVKVPSFAGALLQNLDSKLEKLQFSPAEEMGHEQTRYDDQFWYDLRQIYKQPSYLKEFEIQSMRNPWTLDKEENLGKEYASQWIELLSKSFMKLKWTKSPR